MQIYVVQIASHLCFGAWRDPEQAKGWIADLEKRYQPLVVFSRDSGDMGATKLFHCKI